MISSPATARRPPAWTASWNRSASSCAGLDPISEAESPRPHPAVRRLQAEDSGQRVEAGQGLALPVGCLERKRGSAATYQQGLHSNRFRAQHVILIIVA